MTGRSTAPAGSRFTFFTKKTQLVRWHGGWNVTSIDVLTRVRLASQWVALGIVGAAAGSAAAAPRFLCYPIVPGESVVTISARLTGDSRSWQGRGFQIFDPVSARFVPKPQYGRLAPNWQACVDDALMVSPAAVRHERGVIAAIAVLLCAALVAAFFAVEDVFDRRKRALAALKTFGAAFIREFERPLLDQRRPETVVRSELAPLPGKTAIEVRLAPADGHRYPNLTDHRKNLEYDVERVMNLLNDRRFLRGPLRARGSWVAIPFRLDPNSRKEGGM